MISFKKECLSMEVCIAVNKVSERDGGLLCRYPDESLMGAIMQAVWQEWNRYQCAGKEPRAG